MELKPGYKQTELGVIPEDWSVAPLGKHATFRTGPFGSALHKSDYTIDGVPVVNPMHIVDRKIEPTRTMTISETVATHLSDFRMSPGEIVIGRRGDMGRCAVVQEHHKGWLCGTGSMIIRLMNVDANFLQRVLSSPRAISAIEDSSVGTTMVNLNQGTLAGLMVQIPPLPEQRAIATALSDVDAMLSALEQLIAKKRDIKQAAMQELLTGKRRLPGFEGEWEEVSLGSVSTMNSGGTPPTGRTDYYGGGIPWVSISDMTSGGKYLSETERTLSDTGLANCAAKVFPAGTVLYAMYASLGECSIALSKLTSSQAILGIRPRPELDDEYLYYYLNSIHDRVKEMGQQGTQSNLNKGMVRAFVLPMPDKEEQVAIAEVLNTMDRELAMLKKKLVKMQEIKQGMMQELLTGRVRLV